MVNAKKIVYPAVRCMRVVSRWCEEALWHISCTCQIRRDETVVESFFDGKHTVKDAYR